MSKKDDKYRSTKHALMLYPDDEKHVNALDCIKSYDYAIILHDKDTDDDGIIKKSHYHVIIRTQNATWNTSLAKEFGITSNYIQRVRNMELALEYLIHYNEENKFQYPIDDVKGSLKKVMVEYINKDGKTEGEKVTILINYIQEQKHLTITEFSTYCASAGYWDVYRRSANIFINIIKEHNESMRFAKETEQEKSIIADKALKAHGFSLVQGGKSPFN